MPRLTKIPTTFIEKRQELVDGYLKEIVKVRTRSHYDEMEIVKKINELVEAINNLNDNVFV